MIKAKGDIRRGVFTKRLMRLVKRVNPTVWRCEDLLTGNRVLLFSGEIGLESFNAMEVLALVSVDDEEPK